MMKTLPKIGARVRYTRAQREHLTEARTCDGVAVGHFRGGYEWLDEEGVSRIMPDAVCVQADEPLPAWWPYNGTNRFAPEITEIESI